MTRDDLERLWADVNVRSFAKALRMGEGTDHGDDGYRTMFGGARFTGPDGVVNTFDDFADHPRKAITFNLRNGKHLTSTAAGAYQILERTWDGLVKTYGFEDFSPHNQDLACCALIVGRGAMDDVVAGRLKTAVAKCNREWASLPGSPYGQPTVTMADFEMAVHVAWMEDLTAQPQPQTKVVVTEVDPKFMYNSPLTEAMADMDAAKAQEPAKVPLQKVGWIDALRVGSMVTQPGAMKNKSILAVIITTGIALGVQIGEKHGIHLDWLDGETAAQLAGVIASLIIMWSTYATSDKVGIFPAKKPPEPEVAGVAPRFDAPNVSTDSGPDRNAQDTMRAGG